LSESRKSLFFFFFFFFFFSVKGLLPVDTWTTPLFSTSVLPPVLSLLPLAQVKAEVLYLVRLLARHQNEPSELIKLHQER